MFRDTTNSELEELIQRSRTAVKAIGELIRNTEIPEYLASTLHAARAEIEQLWAITRRELIQREAGEGEGGPRGPGSGGPGGGGRSRGRGGPKGPIAA